MNNAVYKVVRKMLTCKTKHSTLFISHSKRFARELKIQTTVSKAFI